MTAAPAGLQLPYGHQTKLETLNLPRTGRLEIDIHLSAEINITATVARRRVNRYVVSEIGNLLFGGEPTLVVGKRICWRVPVILSYPHKGPIGEVGALNVPESLSFQHLL